MTKYYWSTSTRLVEGSIVEPGSWGRMLNVYTTNHNGWMMSRELAFELVRVRSYPHLPSRFSCAFVFETAQDAESQRHHFTASNTIYEVELVTPEAPIHRADFTLVDTWPEAHFLPLTLNAAERYWRGEVQGVAEILTLSALRVGQVISTGPAGYHPAPAG